MVYLSHWMFAVPPLHNPLPALRWRGEETRGAGLLRALEMVHSFGARNGFKPTASHFLHANFTSLKTEMRPVCFSDKNWG